MGKEINLLDRYPTSQRPVDERAKLITDEHRATAREFGAGFFDGDRLTGTAATMIIPASGPRR